MTKHTKPAPEGPILVPLDAQLCFALYSASIAMQRIYKPLLDDLGITYTQYLVLCTLWEDGDTGVGGIANRLALESSTITPAAKRLEAAGFVSRRRSPSDERQVLVSLTDEGIQLRPRTYVLHEAVLKNSGCDVPELVGLVDQLHTLIGHLREAKDPPQRARAGVTDCLDVRAGTRSGSACSFR